MVHTDLQEALKQLSSNEEFRKDFANDCEGMNVKYGMTENGLVAIKSIDVIGIEKKELRPVAFCCTCFVAE